MENYLIPKNLFVQLFVVPEVVYKPLFQVASIDL